MDFGVNRAVNNNRDDARSSGVVDMKQAHRLGPVQPALALTRNIGNRVSCFNAALGLSSVGCCCLVENRQTEL